MRRRWEIALIAALLIILGGYFASLMAQTGFGPSPNQLRVGLAVNSPTSISLIKLYTPTLTPASTAAAVCASQSFTVSGVTTDDTLVVNPPAPSASLSLSAARVASADTVSIRFCNPTAGALTAEVGVYRIFAVRQP